MTAQGAFYTVFNGRHNFLTRTFVDYRTIPERYYIEISKGTGIDGCTIYGVTVIDFALVHRCDLSMLFYNWYDAIDYIDSLHDSSATRYSA